jgi:hypothetical protein
VVDVNDKWLEFRPGETMHFRAIAFLFAVAAPGALAARSLDGDYARLCLDPAKPNPGMCRELAAALGAKGIPLPVATSAPNTAPKPAPAPPQANASPWRERWGVFADMIGREIVSTSRIETGGDPMVTEARTRLDWVVPGQKMVSRLQVEGTWRDISTIEWDATSGRLVTVTATPPATSYMRVLADGSVEMLETTQFGNTTRSITRVAAPGRYEAVAEIKKDGIWTVLLRNTMQVSAATVPAAPTVAVAPAPGSPGKDEALLRQAQAQRDEISRRLDDRRRARELAERERLQEAQDAEVAEREAQRIEDQAAWEAQDAADEKALQDSLDQLNRIVADAQSRVMHASADSRAGAPSAPVHGYIEIEDKPKAPVMPDTPSARQTIASSKEPPQMGFVGATCDAARGSAQRWVGTGGTFEVVHETLDSRGWCTITINLDTKTSGGGTASSQ